MSSHKNHPEGIALLSIYADEEEEEEDDVMDDATQSPLQQPPQNPDNSNNDINEVVGITNNGGDEDEMKKEEFRVIENDEFPLKGSIEEFRVIENDEFSHKSSIEKFRVVENEEFGLKSSIEEFRVVENEEFVLKSSISESDRSRGCRLTIVDYAHDEMAMSPEPEEGEILATGRVTYGEELQVAAGELPETTSPQTVQGPSPVMRASPPQSSDRNGLQKPNTIVFEAGLVETEEDITLASGESKEVDPLVSFLPPLPKEKCSEELQVKIEKFLNLKKSGKSYNAEVRKKKEYRNPDFLLHAVTYQDIDQIGSCFRKDLFDPHGYDKSDFYDALETDMRREMERKEQERKKSPKVDFISGGSQPGIVIPTPKHNLPITAANLPPAAAVGGTDGRANKKSKWDKVDGDTKNSLSTGAQDAISAVLLSAANAGGGGYSAFAQQPRREADDKRSERKLEKRS